MTASALEQLLDGARAQRRTPCARLLAIDLRGGRLSHTVGKHTYDESSTVLEHDHLFDLASLTKVVVTTSLTLLQLQHGRLKFDETMDTYLPERRACRSPQPTIRQLLAHCAGLPAGLPFHRTHAQLTSRQQQIAAIISTPLCAPPAAATTYSDIGFMLLGIILERVTDTPLDLLAQQLLFKPLGMTQTTFCPPPELHPRCVPTELQSEQEQASPWQGVVHDECARWLGGVAGHAGLFSTADDLARFARALLQPSSGPFAPELVRHFTTPARLTPQSDRCLGWQAPAAPCSGGGLLSDVAFGHTGFTGTSLWLDPAPHHACAVILLTNAVHPLRAGKTRYFSWRNLVHTQAMRTLLFHS